MPLFSGEEERGGGDDEDGTRSFINKKKRGGSCWWRKEKERLEESEGQGREFGGFLVEGDGLDRGIEGEEVLDMREGDLFERAGPDRRTSEGFDLQHRSDTSVKIVALLLIHHPPSIIHHPSSIIIESKEKREKKKA